MVAGISDWKARCIARKQQQEASIPPEWRIELPAIEVRNVMQVPEQCGLLTHRELGITEIVDVSELLDKLRSSELSAEEVVIAFYKRAIIAQQLTNCLTEIFVDQAITRGRELDHILETTGKVVGPLHGLPISLKDQFTMKGLETIMGYTAWIGDRAETDCSLVEILYQLGANPFTRTNVPQTLMWGETNNHVFGRTTNPYNRYCTPGGSSGGEGALIAMKGSILGVGTDIGGSLRIPSSFCGLYTLRPSYERLPYDGAVNALEGQESISSVLGPMANSVSALKIFTKAILDTKPWLKDPLVIRKGWCENAYGLIEHGGGQRLCFGIMWDNGVVKPHPPLQRAMLMFKEALELAGHIVVDWIPHRHMEIYKNAETIFIADGGTDYAEQCRLSGEPLIETMRPEDGGHPTQLGTSFVEQLVGPPVQHTAYELWRLHREKRELRKSHLDYWQSTAASSGTGRRGFMLQIITGPGDVLIASPSAVDAIISPGVAYCAVPHGLNTDSFYTTLCNAMDYTTSVFPVTFADSHLDVKAPPHEFHNHEDEAMYHLYDPDLFNGLPVALQLIGGCQEEEAVIAMTEIVDKALATYKTSSGLA